jgi:transcriptional regulator with XRE-family HTH domain
MGADHATPRTRSRDRDDGQRSGAVLRQARVSRGLTQAELGALCGYSASQISRLECGRQPLNDVDLLRRFAEVLSISPQLFGLAPDPFATRGTNYFGFGGQSPMVSAEARRRGGDSSVRRRELLVSLTSAAALSSIPRRPAPALSPSEPADLLISRLNELAPARPPAQRVSRSIGAATGGSWSGQGRFPSLPVLLACGPTAPVDRGGDEHRRPGGRRQEACGSRSVG